MIEGPWSEDEEQENVGSVLDHAGKRKSLGNRGLQENPGCMAEELRLLIR